MKILRNINFWGLLISNLAVGNFVLFFLAGNTLSIYFCMSIVALLVYFILFKKVNFAWKTKRKLLFYSFISTMTVVIVGIFVSAIVMNLTELLTPLWFEAIFSLLIIAVLSFALIMIPVVFCAPFFIIINFLWLLKEKKDSEKKSEKIIPEQAKKPFQAIIRELLLTNTFVIIFSMILIYIFTPDGWEGGTLGKKYGNLVFLILLALNLLYSFYYVIKINRSPKRILFLVLNLIAFYVIYNICAIIHSISKVGL